MQPTPSMFQICPHSTVGGLVLVLLLGLTGGARAELRYVGSDTVEPVVEAAEVAYQRGHSNYKVSFNAVGTASGLRQLCSGRVALVGAARKITPQETQTCAQAGIQSAEIAVAIDAVALVVPVTNSWLNELKLSEVNTLFNHAASGKVVSWKQVRSDFPDLPIHTAGVGIKHGTFAFFSQSVGMQGFIRSDFKDFADHMATGRFVAADAGAIGFMPLGNALAMEGQVRVLGIDFGSGSVKPTRETILAGKYDQLARTVYLYVNSRLLAAADPQDIEFTRFLVRDMEKYVSFANLIPLRSVQYQENIKRVSLLR